MPNSVKSAASNALLPLSSDAEPRQNPPSTPLVRMPNSYSTYTYKQDSVCKSQYNREHARKLHPNWQGLLHALEAEQRIQAVSALRRVSEDLRLPIIEQWQHRCSGGTVGNPVRLPHDAHPACSPGKVQRFGLRKNRLSEPSQQRNAPFVLQHHQTLQTPNSPKFNCGVIPGQGARYSSRLKGPHSPRHGSSVPSERGDEP